MRQKFLTANIPDVICIGGAVVDIPLQPVDKDIFDGVSYPLERIAITTGGDALNEAIIISRLGYRSTLMTKVGKDMMGNYIIQECLKNNVDVSCIVVADQIDTTISIALIRPDGERTFVTNRNGSSGRTNIGDVDFSRFKDAKIISLASIFNNPLFDNEALVRIFSAAKSAGLIVCADIKPSKDGKGFNDIRQALSLVDYFFPNYSEAAELTGKNDLEEISEILIDAGVKYVVIKTGKDGCYIRSRTECHSVSAYSKANRVDTTGAGDNFAAGFIVAILDGLSLVECGKFANGVASVSIQTVGATTGVQNRQQVYEMMKTE
jgi:sugar/nucleoside kinase (ribokinase family)